MTSTFIALVHPELKPDMNEETAALLRVMVYTQNNTAFGGQVPTVPQPWTGPPRRIVQVQAILVASLLTSLLSAFLAMLGKQWLNRCMPVDTRGTIIQRNQYRQRKFDGIVNWYFENVMEALPLMLQVALLLLGCALSRYLWEINTTVASVVIGITGFGLLFYAFIVIAGVVSEDCPYQTPVAVFLRYIPVAISHTPTLLHLGVRGIIHFIRAMPPSSIPHIFRHIRDKLQRVPQIFHRPPLTFGVLRSGFYHASDRSITLDALMEIHYMLRDLGFMDASDILKTLVAILILPILPIADLCRAIIWLLISLIDRAHTEQSTKEQTVGHALDLRCVLWTLQTSVDVSIRQSTLEYLVTITMDDSNPTQVIASWFGIFLNCVQVTDGSVAIIQGYELLAEKYSLLCLRALSHIVVADLLPKALEKVLEDVRQQFTRTFPSKTNFGDLPISHTLGIIQSVLHSNRRNTFLMRPLASWAVQWRVQWGNYQPSGSERAIVTPALVKFAQFGYKGSGRRAKVPRWLLRFAVHSLSQDPLPPPSVVSDSLSIIAIDLECGDLDAVTVEPLDRR